MEEQKLLKRKKKAVSENNKILLTTTCIDLAEYYFREGRYELSIKEYETVASKYKEMKNLIDYARSNRRVGEAYTHLREYNTALRHQEIHLRVAVDEYNKPEEQRALATIGHTYLTSYLDKGDRNALILAEKSFQKSLTVCESLTSISQREHMDMTARLFANLGVVQECLGNYKKGIELVKKSISICKEHDIYEQLERGYTFLGSLYAKKGEYSSAIHHYNLSIEVARRLEDKIVLTCAALLSKAEILIKLSDFHSAKNILLKAYKLKNPNKGEMEYIEHILKVVAVMCYTEDRLLTTNETDYETIKQLYEKMGDGACDLKNFPKAIEYYQKMLHAAICNKESEERMGPCYISLAQTYSDNEQYDKALEFFRKDYEINKDNPKERITSLLSIAETMDLADKNTDDIENTYEEAIALCKDIGESQLQGRIVAKYVKFLQKYNMEFKIEELQRASIFSECTSDSESDVSDIQTTPNIGADINIEDITDVSEDEIDDLSKSRTTRKRNKGFTIKKNSKGETALHTACIAGNYALVQKLLEQGHTVNIRDNCGWLPIHEACICGHLNIVKILVKKGAIINDRGGTLCNGMTPLHDAAVNGHLDVIEYLLDNGASIIAKNDAGETAFQIFQKWRSSVNLDPISQSHYELLSKRMVDALERSGHHKDTIFKKHTDNAALVMDNEEYSSINKRKSVHYSISSSSDDENMEIDEKSSDACLSDADSISNEARVTEQYQEVMKNLRHRVIDNKTSNKPCKIIRKKTAILGADEVGDDWLDDDLGRNKRRKPISNKFTSTSTLRIPTGISAGFNAQPRELSSELDGLITADVDFKENHAPFGKIFKKRKRQMSLLNAGVSLERSSSPLSVNTQTLSAQRQRTPKRKHHQLKLGNFMEDETVAEPDSTTQSPISQMPSIGRRESNGTIVTAANEIMSSIDVRIQEKLYRVPFVFASRNTLTIKWLAEEAAKRYSRKEYMKPVLELETKNGAVLGEDDYINILFPLNSTQAEEVTAKIIKLNVSPLTERYKETCSSMNLAENCRISQTIQNISAILDLSDCNLRGNTLNPLCVAINHQTTLCHLNLSGNCIVDECLELLCSSLPSLENLNTLNLSKNLLSSNGVHHIANVFTKSEKNILENLVKLDFSYNPMGNDSLKSLAIITRDLKLRSLKLVDVDFTSTIFENSDNRCIELYLDYIEEFDISENSLDKEDILKFMFWIRPTNLQILNIANNKVMECGLLVETLRIFETSNTMFWKFQSLNFSRCKVTDVEVHELLRLLSRAEHFITLNLSYNKDLTAISLQNLLCHDALMRNLYLEGCPNILKNFDISDEDAWKLSEKTKIKMLRLSVDKKMNEKECSILTSIWTDKYHEQSNIFNELENFIMLSIS